MSLAQRLIPSVPEHSLTLFDRGYYSLGLLHCWQNAGTETHWLLPARKDLQFTVKHQLNEHDAIITWKTTPQARKKFESLPETLDARLTSYELNGKVYRILSSMVDVLRYPYDEIVDVDMQRWEIELGFR